MKEKFTIGQIADWKAYEKVRVKGLYNMLDPKARRATGLTEERYGFVMSNYSELKEFINTPLRTEFQEKVFDLTQQLRNLIIEMPSKGDKSEDCQRQNLLNRLYDFENCVNGVEEEDFK